MEEHECISTRLKKLKIKNIVTNDINAWKTFKIEKKIYNKLWLCELQNIGCGPMGTIPNIFPVIIKPIINLYGMSRGFKIIYSLEEYLENQIDGFFWMPYFQGNNYTLDVIFDKGKIITSYCLQSFPSINGTFKYHKYIPDYKLSEKNINLLQDNFKIYSGYMNIEIINNNIIEGHLRPNGDSYFYSNDFLVNISNLINNNLYSFNKDKDIFYLFPYFVNANFNKSLINQNEIEKILISNNVYNIDWFDIESLYQRKELQRLFMYKADSLEKGLKIKKLVTNYFFIKEKIFNRLK